MKDATLKFEQTINFSNNEQMQSENTLWATFTFRYTCPSNRASAWDLKNLRFKANPSETDINTTSISPKFNIYYLGKDIIIEGADGTNNAAFNMMGQCIAVQKDRITVPTSGIYLVRINNEIHKIVIK